MFDTPIVYALGTRVTPELVGQVQLVEGDDGARGRERAHGHAPYGRLLLDIRTRARARRPDSEGKQRPNEVGHHSLDRGGVPFMLHDGTGGIKVNMTSFKRTEYGQMLKRWSGAFAESLGKQLMAQATASMFRGTRVTGHCWTIYGSACRSGLLARRDRCDLLLNCKPKARTVRWATAPSKSGQRGRARVKCTLMRALNSPMSESLALASK